jgi:hypothetical protein
MSEEINFDYRKTRLEERRESIPAGNAARKQKKH